MAMTAQIKETIAGFKTIILGGIPMLLRQNETAFLSFMCSVAAIDALAGYRYSSGKDGDRFEAFIQEYFPARYSSHAANLYKLRCRLLHNFSPAYFTLSHACSTAHLQASNIGDTILSDDAFFSDLRKAAQKFFKEVQRDADRQKAMSARLANLERGGAIYYAK
jgi:hypothetical protein